MTTKEFKQIDDGLSYKIYEYCQTCYTGEDLVLCSVAVLVNGRLRPKYKCRSCRRESARSPMRKYMRKYYKTEKGYRITTKASREYGRRKRARQ